MLANKAADIFLDGAAPALLEPPVNMMQLGPITTEVAEVWGRLNAAEPLPVVDGLMAATA